MTDTPETIFARYQEALRYAVEVIQAYESEIRNSSWTGVDLFEKGFCQGRIYTDAVPRITRILEGASRGI